MKTKNKFIAFGAVTTVVASVVIPTSVIMTHSSRSNMVIKANFDMQTTAMPTLAYGAFPNGLSYQDVMKQFPVTKDGFTQIYQTLEKINPDTKFDFGQLGNFYDNNTAKAVAFINYVNSELRKRGFWSSLWSGITHVATSVVNTVASAGETVFHAAETAVLAVGTEVVEGANIISGGALNSAVNTMGNLTAAAANATANSAVEFANSAADLIKDVIGIDLKDLSNTDWLTFGLSMMLFFVPFGDEAMGIAGAVEAAKASAIKGMAEGAGKTFVGVFAKTTAKLILAVPHVEFLKASLESEYEKTYTLSEAKNDPDFPHDFLNSLVPGDYYFLSGPVGHVIGMHYVFTN